MGKAFESPSTSLDDGVADQPVDEQRQRAHRHTPAAADVDRLELTTGHQLVDGRSSDRQSAGGSSGGHEQLVAAVKDSFMRASARTVTVLARRRSTRRAGSGVILDNRWVSREVPSRRESACRKVPTGGRRFVCGPRALERAARSRMRIAWHHPTASPRHTRSTTSPVWPQPQQCRMPFVEMQLQRGGAVEVAMGGQPSHVVKAVVGAGVLDGAEVPGCSR